MKLTHAPKLLKAPLFLIAPFLIEPGNGTKKKNPSAWSALVALALLPFALTGCFLKKHQPATQQAAPPVVQAAPPTTQPVELPPSANTVAQPAPPPETKSSEQPAKPKPPARHKKPAATPPQTPSKTGVSAIGQLSSGDSSDQRRQTAGSIAATEHGLNNIGRRLNDQEEKTAGQIREFLKQARAALGSGDVAGAQTLAAKAKVLLGELSR
jgi:hypothetical protein